MDVVRQSKIAEVLGNDYSSTGRPGAPGAPANRRSASKDRTGPAAGRRESRDSLDSVVYEKAGGDGDEVSIGVEWSGDGVSMSTT